MVGGKIIENTPHRLRDGREVRRLWCMDANGDECVVYADPTALAIALGAPIWWQGNTIYADGDAVQFRKIGNSFSPTTTQARGQ